MRPFRNYTFHLVLVLLILTAGVGFVGDWSFTEAADQKPQTYYEKTKIFRNVLSYVRQNYVDKEKLSPQRLVYSSIDGMLESLDDPYSRLMRPQEYKNMRTETDQEFGGLGIFIAIKEGKLTVIAPIEGTPAFRAGLMPGDTIEAINGKSTEDITKTSQAVKKLRGPRGTRVNLTIGRDGDRFKVTIQRDEIPITSVYHRMLGGDRNIGYLKITNFGRKTHREVRSALDELHRRGMEGLMVDLRGNPGGLLRSAYRVADIWIDEGNIVYTRGRTPGSNQEYPARKQGGESFYPMTVLVNGGSASGSEILTGALKDHERALVMGDTTFGKGLVQSVFPLSDGSALALTTARYYTPDGRMIQDQGIVPHFRFTQDYPDTGVRRQIQELVQGDTVLNFVKEHKHPTDEQIDRLVGQLREQGFTLDSSYIKSRVRRQQLAMEGQTVVVDPSTDPQLQKCLRKFRETLDYSPWQVSLIAKNPSS